MRTRVSVRNLLLSVGLLGVAVAAGAISPTVTVEYTAPTLTVTLAEPADLQTVLEALCESTRARCEVDASAAEIHLEPITLTGTWDAVVSKLLEGTGLNYASVAPSQSQRGRLIVQARRPGQNVAPVASSSPRAASEARMTDRGVSAGLALPQEATSQDNHPSNPSTDSASPGEQRPYMGGGEQAQPDPEMMRQSIESVRTLYEGLSTPKPPLPPGASFVLPYPDANGNPITVVPVANPTTFTLPWPDANGNPIVVKPGPPQKLEYPIPPTYPPQPPK